MILALMRCCVIVLLFVGCFRVRKWSLYFSCLCLLLLGYLCGCGGGVFVYCAVGILAKLPVYWLDFVVCVLMSRGVCFVLLY